MRLEPIAPDRLTDEQRRLHDEMKPKVEAHLKGFVSEREDGALIGPFAPLLHYPAWGGPAWAQTKSLLEHTVLPKPAHEVAILVVGAALGARYELYAHERVGENTDLGRDKVATIVAGQRPADLTREEAAAYDFAAALMRGGDVPDATSEVAVEVLGDEGAAELVFLVGGYSLISSVLNGFDMPVPE